MRKKYIILYVNDCVHVMNINVRKSLTGFFDEGKRAVFNIICVYTFNVICDVQHAAYVSYNRI